jgi:DNA mismatch endonuclease (patch repair protein)
MRGNRKRDTSPELALRRAVHGLGLRYRVAERPLRDRRWTADLVFRSARVAVFVDGCYWHGCPTHFKPPRTNSDYWGPKIARNKDRDALVDRTLANEGWAVVRFWEHDDPVRAASRVAEVVGGRTGRAERLEER